MSWKPQPAPYKPPFQPPWWKRIGPRPVETARFIWSQLKLLERSIIDWFKHTEPTFGWALLPLLLLSIVLFIRHPATNYIFDEQEALLANPYVNGSQGLRFGDAIYRDFWGLPPNASIGSYRPLPDFIWRSTWWISKHPFFHHLYNLVFHAINGALLASFAFALTKRRLVGWLTGAVFVTAAVVTEAVSGIVGIADVLGGLGAIGALCALRLPATWMPLGVFAAVSFGLFSKESALVCVPLVPVAMLLFAPQLHPQRPMRFLRGLLSLLAAAAAFVLYVELRKQWFPSPLPAELKEALPEGASQFKVLYHDLLIWFHQAPLPKDPLNNPLAEADTAERIAGALRVYWRGLTQVLMPLTLSGDYSFPQEPIPKRLDEWETLAGGAMMILPLALSPALLLIAWLRERADKRRLVEDATVASAFESVFRVLPGGMGGHLKRIEMPLIALPRRGYTRKKIEWGIVLLVAGIVAFGVEFYLVLWRAEPHWVRTWPVGALLMLVGGGLLIDGWRGQEKPMDAAVVWPWRHIGLTITALAMTWTVVSYFPHSNIPVVLPTVRAERFWYFPVIGTSLGLGALLAFFVDRWGSVRIRTLPVATTLVASFLLIQAMQAYRHSTDYRNDLEFWHATKIAVPRSAKAHLNYSVMVGARGDLETRLRESHIAARLAPEWSMASIYTGDTLCRMHRAHEAWPHYAKGFKLGPNDRSLIALALQCMYDEKILTDYDEQLRKIADEEPGSWIAYLAVDTLDNHEEHKGVDPEYRPRGYNEGPKDE